MKERGDREGHKMYKHHWVKHIKLTKTLIFKVLLTVGIKGLVEGGQRG